MKGDLWSIGVPVAQVVAISPVLLAHLKFASEAGFRGDLGQGSRNRLHMPASVNARRLGGVFSRTLSSQVASTPHKRPVVHLAGDSWLTADKSQVSCK
jgi:hypothetical protein